MILGGAAVNINYDWLLLAIFANFVFQFLRENSIIADLLVKPEIPLFCQIILLPLLEKTRNFHEN